MCLSLDRDREGTTNIALAMKAWAVYMFTHMNRSELVCMLVKHQSFIYSSTSAEHSYPLVDQVNGSG